MPFIYSTMSQDTTYNVYGEKPAGSVINNVTQQILIRGGANVANRKALVTPVGVVTEVSDATLAELQKNETFQRQLKAGVLKVDAKKVEVEKVVKDMNPKDGAAQKVASDFAKNKKCG